MADSEWKGANFKQVEDFTEETKTLLERINATTVPVLLRSSNKSLDDIVSEILVLEKTTRLAGDNVSTQKLAVEVLRIYRTQEQIAKMLETLDMLMKKRAQTKQVQSAMIAECAVVLRDGSLAQDKEEEVLDRLAHVTENKIHVELEHARFTIELSKINVALGKKRPALEMLRTLHIETITNMPRVEKLEALNNQISLCLELEDYEQTPSVSRKINYRALAREESTQQKLIYFSLMRQYFAQRKSFFNVARCWHETYLALKDTDSKLAALSNMSVHYLIAEHASAKELEEIGECAAFSPNTKTGDRVAALNLICDKLKSDLEDLPQIMFLLQRFRGIELVRDKIKTQVSELCAEHEELAPYPDRQQLLQDHSSEHDLMVISRFYTRIPLVRLAELVGLTPEHTETFIMEMVSSKSLYAKMDRVDGLVVFEAPKHTTEVIAAWNKSVERSVSLLDTVSHLITKERMLHNMTVA